MEINQGLSDLWGNSAPDCRLSYPDYRAKLRSASGSPVIRLTFPRSEA